MKVDIPKDIKELITTGGHPATLSTQIPAGLNFDGNMEEATIAGHAEVRWNCATPPRGSLRFRFTARDDADAGQIERFSEYFGQCTKRIAEQRLAIPVGHVVLSIQGSCPGGTNERGSGFCNGLPQFKRLGGKWVAEDELQQFICAASEIDSSKPRW